MINTKSNFKTASEAFDYFYIKIKDKGISFDDTKALFNVGFYIHKPLDNKIKSSFRKWKKSYAEAEWLWYLSADKNINKLEQIYGKVPKIWVNMADEFGNVNSNYGWQWERKNQLKNIINILKKNPNSRQAAISIYDAKELSDYSYDTPCTYAVQFTIIENKLNMSVVMRSNDLWYGFCNDQYQFSNLLKLVADKLKINIGWYYHYAHNLHLYNNKI
jgi:thymidylate synthase